MVGWSLQKKTPLYYFGFSCSERSPTSSKCCPPFWRRRPTVGLGMKWCGWRCNSSARSPLYSTRRRSPKLPDYTTWEEMENGEWLVVEWTRRFQVLFNEEVVWTGASDHPLKLTRFLAAACMWNILDGTDGLPQASSSLQVQVDFIRSKVDTADSEQALLAVLANACQSICLSIHPNNLLQTGQTAVSTRMSSRPSHSGWLALRMKNSISSLIIGLLSTNSPPFKHRSIFLR